MMKTVVVILAIAMGLLTGASEVRADEQGWWSMVASGCIPAVATGTNYTNSGGAVATLSGHQIILYCPISNSANAISPTTIDMNSKGSSTHGSVTGKLVKVNVNTQAETLVATIGPATGAGHTSITDTKACFLPAFDFTDFNYYIVVTLTGNPVGWPPEIQTFYGLNFNNSLCQ